MTVSKAFNATVDFALSRPAWQLRLTLYAVLALAAWGWLAHRDADNRDVGAQGVRDSVAEYTALRLHAQKNALAAVIAKKDPPLTRILRRTDTLLRQIPETIVTHDDTVRAIQGLPALRLATDSAIRACSDYQDWFAKYRTACDSLDDARRTEIRGLKHQLDAVKPSKTRTVVTWAAILAAGYVGFRAGRR